MSDSPFKHRNRAPATGTAFDFIRLTVPCPKCGENDLQPLAELIANDTTACGYCGAIIDMATESWRTRLAEEAEIYKKIKPA